MLLLLSGKKRGGPGCRYLYFRPTVIILCKVILPYLYGKLVMLVLIYMNCLLFLFLQMYILFTQAQFSQMRPVAMGPSVPPRMPMYPPGPSGLGQQFLYGQAPPAIIPQVIFCLKILVVRFALLYMESTLFNVMVCGQGFLLSFFPFFL